MEKTLEAMRAKFADRLGKNIVCECGRTHRADIDAVLLGKGAVQYLPDLMTEHGYHSALVLADENTWKVAGERICDILKDAAFTVYSYVYEREDGALLADERAIEEGKEAFLTEQERPDVIIAVGSGTLNDLGKVIANDVDTKEWSVGTAPSMDGYASTVSALVRNNLKVTEYYDPPEVIIGDLDILRTAPREMVLAGIADMAGKYNARLDWRISHIVNDEYYCPFIADGMLQVTDDIIDLALEAPSEGDFSDELLERLMEGLILSGVYMSYTGTSRAASGCEHHFSHFWEMWLQVHGKPPIFHGVKVGVGAMTMAWLYPKFLEFTIDRDAAIAAIDSFDEEAYKKILQDVYKEAAPSLLAEYHFDKEGRKARLDRVILHRQEIDDEIRAMQPRLDKLVKAMNHLKARTRWDQLDNIGEEQARQAMRHCKEMRPQYTMLQMMQDTAYPIREFEEEWIHQSLQDHKEVKQMEELEQAAVEPEIAETVAEEPVRKAPARRGRKPGSKNKKPAANKSAAAKETGAKRGRKPAASKEVKPAVAQEVPKKKKKEELPYYLL